MSIQNIKADFQKNLQKYVATKVDGQESQKDLTEKLLSVVTINLSSWSESRKFAGWLHSLFSEILSSEAAVKSAKTVEPLYDAREALSILTKPVIDLAPESYHQALILSEVEGRTQKQIATELGLTLTAVKDILHNGRILMKQILLQCFAIS